jgi:hypothetical protein
MDKDLTSEQEFAVLINKVMAKGIQDGTDPDQMAKVCLNTARELYDHYGAGEDHGNYHEFVVSAGFEAAEIEDWLDAIEGRDWQDDT